MKKIQIPIFPLPQSVLYPGIYLPLHIFEDRYKVMLSKVDEMNSELAVSYAPEVEAGKFYPSMICGAGPVRIMNRHPDGSSDILVFGVKRVRIHKYTQEIPYLIGEAEIVPINRDMPAATETELLNQIRDMLINWIFTQFDDSRRPIQFFKNISDLEILCNFVAHHFVSDYEKKQKLLEENELEAKAQVIWQILKDLEASGDKGPASASLIFPGGKSEGDTFN